MTEKSTYRIELEARAAAAKVSFAPNIGDAKLAERVAEAEGATTTPGTPEPAPADTATAGTPAAAEGLDGASAATSNPLVVVVTGPKRGRWRAGRHFTAEPVTIPAEDLSEDEIAALLGDPRLSVETREAD
ncbi:HI1506-related protein [Salipiger thiooxidans]|uniref:HI1506-related protein n=1 Tax=Salipiger thiooxidans TaxID=282683 RepID=UPI001CFB6CF6|nr:HI1506-related protein [Salipiger thiooxidans]